MGIRKIRGGIAFLALALWVGAGCNGGSEFGPGGPGSGGGGGGFTPANLAPVWYAAPNPLDWPASMCDAGTDLQPCLAARIDYVQNGDDLAGQFQCYQSGDFASVTGTFTSATEGTLEVSLCDATGCWDLVYAFTVEADGSMLLAPQSAVSPTTGETCTFTGSGISFPEATSVPVVAGLYDHALLEIPGSCPDCGGASTALFYVIQDEANLTIVMLDPDRGRVVYGAQIDGAGEGGYLSFSVESPPCSPYLDAGTITFQAGGFVTLGQRGCPSCQCQYGGTGARR